LWLYEYDIQFFLANCYSFKKTFLLRSNGSKKKKKIRVVELRCYFIKLCRFDALPYARTALCNSTHTPVFPDRGGRGSFYVHHARAITVKTTAYNNRNVSCTLQCCIWFSRSVSADVCGDYRTLVVYHNDDNGHWSYCAGAID
jgi:hypothetical protein